MFNHGEYGFPDGWLKMLKVGSTLAPTMDI